MNIVINFLVLLSVARADLNLSLKETLLEKNKIPFEEGNIFWRRIVEGSFSFSKPTKPPKKKTTKPTGSPLKKTKSPTKKPTQKPTKFCEKEWVQVDTGFVGEQKKAPFRNRNLIFDKNVAQDMRESSVITASRDLITSFDLPKPAQDVSIEESIGIEEINDIYPPPPALDIKTINESFLGTEYTDMQPRSFPSDPMGAASRSSVIEVTTGEGGLVEAFTRNGKLKWSVTLPDFFESGVRMYDPKVVYDFQQDRFVIIALHREYSTQVSLIGVAVSKNDNPGRNDWYLHTINGAIKNTWADYPGLEVDEEAIYITANRFTFNEANPSFTGSYLFIVDKKGFYNGNSNVSSNAYIFNQRDGVTYMPAEIRDKNGAGGNIGTYLVGYQGLGPVSIVRIRNPLNNPTFEEQLVDIPVVDELPKRLQVAPQKGSNIGLEINQREVFDAAWHDNSLWAVTQMLINDRTTVYWFEFDTSKEKITVIQSGPITGDDIAPKTTTFFPSVTVNNKGVAVFGFSASASSIYTGAFVTYRTPSDKPGTVRKTQVVKEGEGVYVRTAGKSRNRWGDYSGAAVDPADEDCFWLTNCYAQKPCEPVNGEAGCWGTVIARLCTNDDNKVKTNKPTLAPTKADDKKTNKPTSAPNKAKDNICSSLGIDVDVNEDGTIVVAGEPGYDGDDGPDTGRVRIYQRTPGSTEWTETVIDGKKAGGLFGTSVAVSDFQKGWIAVSSFGNNDNGKVDMFKYDGNKWTENKRFDNLGFSVDISGGDDGQETLRVAIGDYRKGQNSGMTEVHQYDKANQNWSLISKFTGNEKEELGYSVALSDDGKFMAVGAPKNDNGKGIVYVYNLSSSDLKKITGEGEENFGTSVAANKNGNVIAVGSPSYDKNVGIVKVYERSGAIYVRKGNDIEGTFNGARIGNSNTVTLNDKGNRLAIGSDSVNNDDKLGVVRIFDYDFFTNEWEQVKKIIGVNDGEVETVALSDEGTTIVIGSPGAKNCRGQVRVFDEVCRDK